MSKTLGKKRNSVDLSVEAYACTCSCGCSCSCSSNPTGYYSEYTGQDGPKSVSSFNSVFYK